MADNNKTTLTISFDDGADSSLIAVAMLDDEKNKNSAGEVKTSFGVRDKPYFLVHLDSKLSISKVRCSSGTVRSLGTVTRTAEAELDIAEADETTDLEYVPAANPTGKWFGNTPRSKRDGRTITWDEPLPAAGKLTYKYQAYSYQYTPPTSLKSGDEWRTHIVIHVQERSR